MTLRFAVIFNFPKAAAMPQPFSAASICLISTILVAFSIHSSAPTCSTWTILCLPTIDTECRSSTRT
ncbi:unnamed protein product [Protopolystoma xenopodis]|uniref:Uncharacterized protein n=1 Tax=Protopolystoma xenopodis TaxID=117903 RepID=A0A3S5A6M8_9PLAT|nr:unnamed protein product [Protopolystoma xenopodis]